MLHKKGGGIFGLRVTPPVLFWFFHNLRWFLLCYETDGTMLVGLEFRLFLLIFLEKETVMRINWLLWGIQLLEWFGWIAFLLIWGLISFGIDVDFLITDPLDFFDGLCCFAVFFSVFFPVFFEGLGLVPPPFVIIFFLFFNKIFLSLAV